MGMYASIQPRKDVLDSGYSYWLLTQFSKWTSYENANKKALYVAETWNMSTIYWFMAWHFRYQSITHNKVKITIWHVSASKHLPLNSHRYTLLSIPRPARNSYYFRAIFVLFRNVHLLLRIIEYCVYLTEEISTNAVNR